MQGFVFGIDFYSSSVIENYLLLTCDGTELIGRFDWNSWEGGLCYVDSACII
jgi:hypothetical protein